jgi:hypothetical protein
VHGGVRFGGTLDLDDAWRLGFDHVAIAAGAGKPTLVDIPNGLARGIRQASDFLMALQLTGAYKNQLARQPARAAARGGHRRRAHRHRHGHRAARVLRRAGEKTLARYETLALEIGEAAVTRGYTAEERAVLDELIAHGRAIRDERRAAPRREGRAPRFNALLDAWGGVTSRTAARLASRRRTASTTRR